jgi:hypothetical protein
MVVVGGGGGIEVRCQLGLITSCLADTCGSNHQARTGGPGVICGLVSSIPPFL